MGDQADVLDAIYGFVLPAVYPNGTSQLSVTGNPIDVAEGWPLAEDIDTAMKASPPRAIVSICAPGVTSLPPQVMDTAQIVTAPVHTIVPSVNGNVVTLGGTIAVGQYVTAILDNKFAFSYAAVANDTLTTMATALAALIKANAAYVSSSSMGAAITIVGATYITIRVGAPGTMGEIVGRQMDQIIVSIWAADPATRTQITKPIDLALRNNLTFNLPDTSRVILRYQRTLAVDRQMKLGEYRRDLVYMAEYTTVNLTTAYEVTSIDITLDPGVGITTPVVQ